MQVFVVALAYIGECRVEPHVLSDIVLASNAAAARAKIARQARAKGYDFDSRSSVAAWPLKGPLRQLGRK